MLPRPEDTMLAVEVANTSMNYDRNVKLALYARSLVPEVWIVNLAAEEVEVYRSPVGDGYTSVERADRSDTLTITAIPTCGFRSPRYLRSAPVAAAIARTFAV
jgi:hypothetical protein